MNRKQTPIKPNNITQEHPWAEKIGNCGNCHHFIKETWKFCPNCGREIDWGEKND